MRIQEIRRENLRQLAKAVGGITQLADKLDKSQSLISQLMGKRPTQGISDRFASAVEKAFAKPAGWLDRIQSLEFEAEAGLALGDSDIPGVLCRQIPLIDWKDIPNYLGGRASVTERV